MATSEIKSDGLFDDAAACPHTKDFGVGACKELFENANDLIQSVDENGRFLYVNKKWRDALGYTEDEASRLAFPDIIQPQHLPACFAAFGEMRKGKSFDNFATQFVAKDGRVIDVEGNISVRVKNGEFISTWGIFRDVTLRNQREQELDHIAKTLVRRDFELLQTNDILRIRDEQIVKEHELNRAKSEFVSLASHQLKTPLTIIKWYIEMLNAGYAGLPAVASAKAGGSPADAPPTPSASEGHSKASADAKALADKSAGKLEKPFDFTQGKKKEYLGIIYRNTERMIELIDAFLNVSRLELGVFSIKKEPINLKDKMELILKNFEPKIKEKSLKLLQNYAKSNFVFAADIKMIQIIFENLISNAIKYTPPGGEIQIKMQKKGNEILIGVVDTGIGIPADQQSKIFTKFFRADNASSYKADGSGLGLYIVKTAVEKIGGKIWFRSPARPVKGSRRLRPRPASKGTAFYVALFLPVSDKP